MQVDTHQSGRQDTPMPGKSSILLRESRQHAVEMVDVETFAELWLISRSTVFDWIDMKILVQGRHYHRVKRIIRFPWGEALIEKLMEDNLLPEDPQVGSVEVQNPEAVPVASERRNLSLSSSEEKPRPKVNGTKTRKSCTNMRKPLSQINWEFDDV